MNKDKQDLIDELARKMAINDLMYDYRIRAITEFADKLEKLFAIPVVVFSEAELKAKLDEQKEEHRQWLEGEGYELLAERL